MEGLFNGQGDLADNLRMLKRIGAKYIGRSLCLWNGEANFLHNLERAKQQVPKALAADPDLILEACVFETVSPGVEQIPIPDWVFAALGQPVQNRNFIYANMIYIKPEQRRAMGRTSPSAGREPDGNATLGLIIRRRPTSTSALKASTSGKSKS